MNVGDISVHVSWFDNQGEQGKPALGQPETLTWAHFVSIFEYRRDGIKDGPCFAPTRFELEHDKRHVRRVGSNARARTCLVLDVEANKITGEVAPPLSEAVERAQSAGLACLGYNSHSHAKEKPRYRLVVPLTAEIAPDLPAPEILAEQLGLSGVLDRSKLNPASIFFLPSRPYDAPDDLHHTIVIPGRAMDAAWMTEKAGALLATRQAEQDRVTAEAMEAAAARRAEKIAAGFDPSDSLIEKLRSRFDLASVLAAHGYDRAGGKYRHPNSESGGFGANIKALGDGIERVFTHNAGDPLNANNLPMWCGGVTAVDAFDAVVILDFGGDRDRALRELAERHGLNKAAERKALATLLFKLIRRQAPQQEIETAAYAEGERRGLSRADVVAVAVWVVQQRNERGAA